MKYSYLALGDSYTIGESVNENKRWQVQLVEKLRRDNIQINTPVAGDGLHPSAAMYSLWVDAVYNYTLNILRKNR